MGHIYLIGLADTPNVFKIGCTKKDIAKRSKQLQTGNSEELYLSRSFETNKQYKLEKMLHLYYANKQLLNEWYTLTPEDVDGFIGVCEYYQGIIDSLSENPFF